VHRPPALRAAALAAALAASSAVSGCAGGSPAEVASDGAPARPAATADAASSAPAPDVLAFTATTVQGQPFDGADYAGLDLMVWFWAPW
jgi:hypothetical protein